MKYELFIAFRYIFSRRKEKFISIITAISILGVSVGVAALIATLAVMNGFDSELKSRIIGSNPHIFIESEFGITNAPELVQDINKIEGVKGSFPYINSQGVVQYRGRARGVAIKSIDTDNKLDASKLMPHMVSVAVNADIEQGIIIGNELASILGAYISDEITLLSPALKKSKKMTITGIFKSGMYDYDANVIYGGFNNLTNIFDAKGSVSGIGVDCVSLSKCEIIKNAIQKKLGFEFCVTTWAQRNKNLFSAIKLEKLAMFLILTLIVVVACFSIVGVLVMTVMEKAKDIGILKAIGVSRKGIITIFSIQGFLIGTSGIIFGIISGFGVSHLLKRFVKLPAQVYYIDNIPIQFNLMDSAFIIGAALIISMLSTIYPAYQASRLDPVQTLRYE